ncbi:4'-phosphopantetheinyl transferase superfamily protein [Carboxylicivirga taeanensis]|uniref:4'-phosphopantetheinyl transferase superfamily protein n=1 Tax=Carboxylicivirga taeanensis TaxID=1416875 RepID=UPI003F6DA590
MPLCQVIDISPSRKVAVWQIEESVEQLASALLLSDNDRPVVDKFRLEKRQKEWLASRLLLKNLLGYYPELIYGDNGKPELINGTAHISISHTDGFAAVSVSDVPTALDIEVCLPRVEKVANRFVHAEEQPYLNELTDKRQCLTLLWSAKETLYKYFNVYGVIFKEQFKVHPFLLRDRGTLMCDFITQQEVSQLELAYFINQDYTLVYC